MAKQRIEPQERRLWLEAADDGRPVTDIAREFERDPRAVRRGIEQARSERAKSRAREQTLVRAWSEHNRDLLNAARALESAIKLPAYREYSFSPADPANEDAARMRRALQSHTRGNSLWRTLTALEKSAGRFEERRLRLIEKIMQRVAEDTRDLRAEFLGGVAQTAFIQAMSAATQQIKYFDDIDYKIALHTDGRRALWLGGFLVAMAQADELLVRIQERHELLLEQCTEWEELPPIGGIYNEMNQLKQRIDKTTETLVLKRVLPGECSYCPG